jgi:hypothetical protein
LIPTKYYFLGNQCTFLTVNALIGSNVREARRHEFPFVVSLMHYNPVNPVPVQDHICTGALVSKQHVLSTAYCIINRLTNQTIVLAGTNNLVFGRLYGISWWITYNEWSQFMSQPLIFEENDISITKVDYVSVKKLYSSIHQ